MLCELEEIMLLHSYNIFRYKPAGSAGAWAGKWRKLDAKLPKKVHHASAMIVGNICNSLPTAPPTTTT